jgi:DNA-binding MarR family transcriptional regulator
MTQTLTGQDIGQAHYATRAVLERVLIAVGIDFNQSVILNVLVRNGSPMAEDEVLAGVVHGLKITEDDARAVLSGVLARGLVTRTPADEARLELTATGAGLSRQVTEAVAGITERLYGGLPAGELAVAHRLLATVTARANAELAAEGGVAQP